MKARTRVMTLVLLAFAFIGAAAIPAFATHFDSDASTGTFDPQLSITYGATRVNQPGQLTLNLTQADHEDPAIVSRFDTPGDVQLPFASPGIRQAQKADGSNTTRCKDAVDNLDNSPNGTGTGTNVDYSKRGDATFARAEKVGTAHIEVQADGVSRPGSPIVWDGDAAFISWDGASETARMCLLLITHDARVTQLPDPDPTGGGDDIEGVVEIVADFTLQHIVVGGTQYWETLADLSDLATDSTFQTLNVSLLNLRAVFFARTVGNWNSAGPVDFARAPAVSGTKTFQGVFDTCPANDPDYGACMSGRPTVTRTADFAITIPAPAIISPSAGSVVNVADVAVSGTSEPNETIALFEGTTALSPTATSDASGAWTTTVFLPQGSHTLKAVASDTGGSSPASAARSFTVDVPPAPPAITQPAEGETLGAGSISVAGNAQPLSTVRVYDDTTLLGSATAGAGGSWTANVTLTAKTAHTLVATAADGGGEGAPSAPRGITVTTATPTISYPAQNAAINTGTFTVTGTAEAGAAVEITEGTTVLADLVAVDGTWSLPSVFTEAPHTLHVVSTDTDGLVSLPLDRDFVVDLTAPDAPVITSPVDGSTVQALGVPVSGTGEGGATIVVRENGAEIARGLAAANGTFTVISSVTEGQHTVDAIALDRATNSSGVSNATTFIARDPLKILKPVEGSVQPAATLVTLTTDPAATEARIYDNGTQIKKVKPNHGTWSGTVLLPGGDHAITARTIVGGSLGAETVARHFTVDASPPTVSIDGAAGAGVPIPGGIALTGKATDGQPFDSGVTRIEVQYSAGGASYTENASCVGCGTGNATWSWTPPRTLATPGAYNVRVYAYDAVGNVSPVAIGKAIIL